MLTQSSNNNQPIVMSDEFAYNKNNENVKIMRNTMLKNKGIAKKRRTVLAQSQGGPFKVIERVQSNNNKTNRSYRVSQKSISNFMDPALNSISKRKNIKKCSNINNKLTLRNNKNNMNKVSLRKNVTNAKKSKKIAKAKKSKAKKSKAKKVKAKKVKAKKAKAKKVKANKVKTIETNNNGIIRISNEISI